MSEEGLPYSARSLQPSSGSSNTASENNYTNLHENYRLRRWRFDFFLIPSRQIVCRIG